MTSEKVEAYPTPTYIPRPLVRSAESAFPAVPSSANRSMRPEPSGSCRYRINEEHGLALVNVRGDVNGAYIAECARALQADPGWSSSFAGIWDERGIDQLDIIPTDLDEMVEAQAHGQTGLDIIITAREDHELVQRLYAWRVRARGRPATVCSSLEEALACLGIDALPPDLAAFLN